MSSMATSNSDNSQPSACPVDHKAREAWLRAAAPEQQPQPSDPYSHPQRATDTSFPSPQTTSQPSSWLSRLLWSTTPSTTQAQPNPKSSASPTTTATQHAHPKISNNRLSTARETSSIPRGGTSTSLSTSAPDPSSQTSTATPQQHQSSSNLSHATSPNAQTSDPVTSSSGHWMYPSEAQFFTALARKHGMQDAPPASTMAAVIPIHNAVNERTWYEILGWEALYDGKSARNEARNEEQRDCDELSKHHPRTQHQTQPPKPSKTLSRPHRFRDASERCGGPKLVSFSGELKTRMTPRARLYSLLGYQEPFDRHDWIVERCGGRRVEYVIDFYEGRGSRGAGSAAGGEASTKTSQRQRQLNFYLDVRPKLNSWEGVKMRVERCLGLS